MSRYSILCLLSLVFVTPQISLASPADQPEPRQQSFEWMSLAKWYAYHNEDKALANQGHARLLFLGDSITQGWDQEIWQRYFSAYEPANFGIGGDKTENLLWRLQNGDIGKLQPELIVLMIGVNNFGHDNDSASEVANGVRAILEEIKKHWKHSQVLLLGILPYGEKQELENRERVKQSNRLLAELADNFDYAFANFGEAFVDAEGNIPRELMADLLHPTAKGYQILADKLAPLINNTMQANNTLSFLNKDVVIEGRYHEKPDQSLDIGFPGVSFHFNFQGKKLALTASSSSGKNLLDVFIDGKRKHTLEIKQHSQSYTLIDSKKEKKYRIELVHRSESWHGMLNIQSLDLFEGHLLAAPQLPKRKILILGDSISCGEAVHREKNCEKDFSWWDAENSYGKLLAEKLDAQVHLVCHGGRGLLRSWNGNTDEANAEDFLHFALSNGKNAPTWKHQNYQADLVLVNIGTNDYSSHAGPFPDKKQFTQAWLSLFNSIQGAYPNAKIAVTEGPMLQDKAREAISQTLQTALSGGNDKHIRHFQLKVRKGDACDAHPTGKEHRAMAKELSKPIREWMNW